MRFLALFFSLLSVLPAYATPAPELGVVTGHKTGTYFAFGQDMAAIAQKKDMKLTVKESDGSVENIKRINSVENAALGIVQSDVLGFLQRSNNPQSKQVVSKLRVVFPFYQEEVHVLARGDIKDFKDLQGKKVAVGEDGSGHMLTAVNLFAIEQIVPSEIKRIPPEEGIVGVLQGDIDAVIFVGGKPVKLFKNMEDLSRPEHRKFAMMMGNVHFLPLNSAKFYEEYEPTEITSQDYNFVRRIVPTIAVQAVLVSYDFADNPAKKPQCALLKKFAGIIRDGLPILAATGHPKWQEVNLDSNVLGWQKDACVWKKP